MNGSGSKRESWINEFRESAHISHACVAIAIVIVLIIIAGCRGGERLDNRVLQLSLVYSVDGPKSATMTGTTGAATGGAEVECRMADGEKQIVGTAIANDRGAFDMELDPAAFPQRVPNQQAFSALNESIECRPKGGEWIHPLKVPRLGIE